MQKPRGSRAQAKPAVKEHLKVPLAKFPKTTDPDPDGPLNPFPIVAIGASAGGPEALTQLVEHLTPNLGGAYVIVEHLDPKHKSILVELLLRQAAGSTEEGKAKT